ncbi:response regulator [Maribacter sp. 2-571]|uniref:response regulator n=1 Tax=Maribacter sp. 2-571 TaxID=3417569 RepID=UPI003D330939
MRQINSICIVDDDPITVFGIKKILNNVVECSNVKSYGNGKLAIDAIKEALTKEENLPDIIFLDINMPIMDGWQFLEEFTQLAIDQKLRVNIITSSIDLADVKRWEHYRTNSQHLITYNNKPIKKEKMAEITKVA